MEELQIDKKYQKTTEKRLEQYSENNELKEREVEVEVDKQENDTNWAFQEAQKQATKKGYASISLLNENERGWKFQLYNKVDKKNG